MYDSIRRAPTGYEPKLPGGNLTGQFREILYFTF